MAETKPPIVGADTDISGKKNRKAKEVKQMTAAEILIAAKNLTLSERALVCKELEKSVKEEIDNMRKSAESAESMINGTK